MRTTASSAVISLVLALALWPQAGQTQSDRDFIFTDLDGHLIIRFAGTGAAGLDSSQAYEILNQEFSRMIHDRLHADLQFADEPQDPEWAASMEPRIAEHVRQAEVEFSGVVVECRAASCRVILEQPMRPEVSEHRAMLETVQKSLAGFISTSTQHFEPVFMITAYYKQFQTPHIKAFLRRTEHAAPAGGD